MWRVCLAFWIRVCLSKSGTLSMATYAWPPLLSHFLVDSRRLSIRSHIRLHHFQFVLHLVEKHIFYSCIILKNDTQSYRKRVMHCWFYILQSILCSSYRQLKKREISCRILSELNTSTSICRRMTCKTYRHIVKYIAHINRANIFSCFL